MAAEEDQWSDPPTQSREDGAHPIGSDRSWLADLVMWGAPLLALLAPALLLLWMMSWAPGW